MTNGTTDSATLTPETQTSAPAGPSLQFQDLVLALQTIQAISARGAVRLDEMEVVGGLYNRLFAFLEAQGAISRGPDGSVASTTTGAPNA